MASNAESAWYRWTRFFTVNPLVTTMLAALIVLAGLITSPFRWDLGGVPTRPVPVDAIPDIGENQQIVFTPWSGRSPQDVEDQITYPLTTALLGIPGVRTVRSFSMFGFSTIYVIFEQDVEFYWSRSRILEKLASLPRGTLPPDASATLGPDATALGQVYWYTLEGRDKDGKAVGGWDPHELRSIQDFTVKYALQGVAGVSEVASVGGHVQEYQVDVDNEALRARNVSLQQVAKAVTDANKDVGARTLELNRVEYVIRGIGFVKNIEDLEQVVVKSEDHTPVRVRDVAKVHLGPAQRRGALDKDGAPAVGGVVVTRFGANPMQVIEAVKARIAEIQPSLPVRQLDDGTESRVTIVPFYDRSELIQETLGTLSTALWQQLLITALVVLTMLRSLRASILISAMLPLGVLGAFVAMRLTGVDANIMALSGVAIAIGTMVDLAIVVSETISKHLDEAEPDTPKAQVVSRATAEVAQAVMTSTLTTVIGFLPIFGLSAAEGKLFKPLAMTKTFAMLAALVLALTVLPMLATLFLRRETLPAEAGITESARSRLLRPRSILQLSVAVLCFWLGMQSSLALGISLSLVWLLHWAEPLAPEKFRRLLRYLPIALLAITLLLLLSDNWLPLGIARGLWTNRLFTAVMLIAVLVPFVAFVWIYPRLLRYCLDRKVRTLAVPALLVAFGVAAWLGLPRLIAKLPESVRMNRTVVAMAHKLPGFGREFMPPFDEGSFLYMPTTMPHASIGEAQAQLSRLDAAIAAIPEIDVAVGKLGRADTALDPAPISMFETVVNYKPEFGVDADGRRVRQWREHIKSPNDIWKEIQRAAAAPGLTSAPELMPIATRIVMLQSGMRAPLGVKVRAPNLHALEQAAQTLEAELKRAPGVRPETVVADRIVGKPYLEIIPNREEIARHSISINTVQDVIQTGIGGRVVTRTVEGRERYPVLVRYMREERDSIDAMKRVQVPSPLGHSIPLEQLASIRYRRGPQVIKSEDTFLTAYVVFDKLPTRDAAGAVEAAGRFLKARQASGELTLPTNVTYSFAGTYENQLRSESTLKLLVPLSFFLIFTLIYLQFRKVSTTLFVFTGVAVAMSGGFILIWLYAQPWFFDFGILGANFRQLFQVHTVHLSVAVWVGFIALIGIATDDGVILATYLKQRFESKAATTRSEVRDLTVEAAERRVRACMMTTATTVLALLPVVTSTGRGSDVMVPMTLPLFGGMLIEVVTLLVIPTLWCAWQERRLKFTDDASAN